MKSRMKPRTPFLLFIFLLLPLSLLGGAELTDSRADFTTDGTQGENGWSYGYREVADGDDRANFDPETDFILFTEDDGWIWTGDKWDWGDGNVPWTEVSAEGGHPNGSNNDAEQWVIRRWAVSAVDEQALALNWHLHKNNTGGGNGVTGSVHLNGTRVDSASVEGTDGEGFDRTVYVNVKPGDVIDFGLLPEGADGNPADGSDGSSFWITITDEIPANPEQPDGSPFFPATAEDSDGDTMPDAWEETFFAGNLGALTVDGDNDGDGLLDPEEFAAGSDPTKADTDEDGLTDKQEVDGGTNPRRVDSDGDGLTDFQEAVVDDILAEKVADSIEDFGEDQGPVWINGYRDYTADGGGEDYDPETEFIPFNTDDGWTWTGDGWDWGDGNVPWTLITAEQLHPNGINNSAEHWAIRRWVASEIATTTPLAVVWNVREENLNGGGVSGSLNVNGVQVAKATVAGGDGVGTTGIYFLNANPGDVIDLGLTPEGPNDGRSDGSDGSFSWMVVSTHIPEGARQPDGSLFVPATGEDSDGDDLPDAWEQVYFPDDLTKLATGGDQDGDGLNDEDEFALNTNPTLTDTDMDGLPDGAERGDGVFTDASSAGSSPTKVDTDGDTLSDGDEANGDPVTDPNKADTDLDGFDDAVEIAGGFDPNDANSNPFSGLIADSVDQFSGVQGQDGWFYGTRELGEVPEEAPTDYDPVADFVPMPEEWWTGVQWDEPNDDGDNIPWTFLGNEGAHPNGTNSGGFEQWAVRRWVADIVEDPTPLGLIYHLRKTNANGNGTTVQLHINGELKDKISVEGNSVEGETRTFYANINPGDIVDLALTPEGADEGRGDGSDGSAFSLRIDTNIPNDPTQPDGSTFVPVVLGDPHLSVPFRSPFGQLGDNPGVQTRTVTLKNSGAANDLTISSAVLVGANSDRFTSDLSVPLTLVPGASQEFTVTFDPNGGDGGFIAALELTSNDENETVRRLDLNANIPDQNKLLAWYKLDETSGERANDSSGNDRHGTYVSNGGAVTLGEPSLAGGTAVRFTPGADETAAHVDIPNFPALEDGQGFSISLWHQAAADLGPVTGLISKNDGDPDSSGRPYALAIATGGLNWFGDGTPDIDGSNSQITTEQASHVVVTYNPANAFTVTIYVDGEIKEMLEDATEITDLRAALQIGAVNGRFGYSGLIDDVQIYGKVMTAEEVAELQANPGQKLGGGDGGGDPQPGGEFRNSLTTVSKAAGSVEFSASLDAATTYDVEYSEDLVTWDVIANDVSVVPFTDNDAARTAKPSGYYRVKE